jgi:hypothetical protein
MKRKNVFAFRDKLAESLWPKEKLGNWTKLRNLYNEVHGVLPEKQMELLCLENLRIKSLYSLITMELYNIHHQKYCLE